MIAYELTSVNCAVSIGRAARGEHPMDRAATVAAASQWGAEPVMSDMEALMWRSEASPRLRSGGVIVDLLDTTPDWDRLVASHEWAVALIGRLRQRVVEDPLRLATPAWVLDD